MDYSSILPIEFYLYPEFDSFLTHRFIDGWKERGGREGGGKARDELQSSRRAIVPPWMLTSSRRARRIAVPLNTMAKFAVTRPPNWALPKSIRNSGGCVGKSSRGWLFVCAPPPPPSPPLSVKNIFLHFSPPRFLLLHASLSLSRAFPSYIRKEFAWASVTVCLVKGDSGVPGNCSLVPCSSLRRRIESARDSLI